MIGIIIIIGIIGVYFTMKWKREKKVNIIRDGIIAAKK